MKIPWTAEEDRLLLEIVSRSFTLKGKWTDIAKAFPNKTDRHCRERYVNHVDPYLKKGKFPLRGNEKEIICKLYMTPKGKSVSCIAKMMRRPYGKVKHYIYEIVKRGCHREESNEIFHKGSCNYEYLPIENRCIFCDLFPSLDGFLCQTIQDYKEF